MSMLGLQYAIHEGQVHAITLLWIDAMGMLSYDYLKKFPISRAKRFLLACSMAVFIFEAHDNLWVTSTLFNLEELMQTDLRGIFVSTPEFYIAKYSRNLIITLASFLFARKYFKLGKKTVALAVATALYWTVVVYLGWTYVAWPVMFCVSSLAFFALS
jgi:hypothetical protein